MQTNQQIPSAQSVALVRTLGGPVEFVDDYPVPIPGHDEVLAKVLYTGVCQSGTSIVLYDHRCRLFHRTPLILYPDLHTKAGTAAGPDGKPITAIKLPHIGGHEGIARIVALGPGLAQSDPAIRLGGLVGVRFSSRVCRRCEFCLAGTEQYCTRSTNHLHHEDGAFQEYVALDAGYLTLLPDDCDPVVMGPVLCAGVTAYKVTLSCELEAIERVLMWPRP